MRGRSRVLFPGDGFACDQDTAPKGTITTRARSRSGSNSSSTVSRPLVRAPPVASCRLRLRDSSYPDAVPLTVDEVRAFAATLPRSSEAFVRGRVKFRVGRIVFLSFSKDGTVMGFGFPKEWRVALVESEPEKFSMPGESDMRYSWVHARLARLDADEMRDLVENAWALCVPKRVVDEYAGRAATASVASPTEEDTRY